MKKLIVILMSICLLFSIASVASLTAYAEEKNTVIVFDAAKQQNNTVKIDVNVRENSGVYSMLLTLDYDETALKLESLTYGSAFSSLDPMASGDYSVVPYRISYLGTDQNNDVSVGNMMTLVFSVHEGASDGEYAVTFEYAKNKDVAYLKDGELQMKNLIVVGAKITLESSEIGKITADGDIGALEDDSLHDDEGEDSTSQDGGVTADKKYIPGIIAGSAIGVSVAAGVAFAVVIVRRKKHKWVKLWQK